MEEPKEEGLPRTSGSEQPKDKDAEVAPPAAAEPAPKHSVDNQDPPPPSQQSPEGEHRRSVSPEGEHRASQNDAHDRPSMDAERHSHHLGIWFNHNKSHHSPLFDTCFLLGIFDPEPEHDGMLGVKKTHEQELAEAAEHRKLWAMAATSVANLIKEFSDKPIPNLEAIRQSFEPESKRNNKYFNS